MRSPRPTSVMSIGDSWADLDGFDFVEAFTNATSIPHTKFAFSGATLIDETTPAGASNALVNNIDSYLAASPNTDFVFMATGGANDLLRLKQGLNTAIRAVDMLAGATQILDKIKAAKKTAIVMCAPWVQLFVAGIGAGIAADATQADIERIAYNNGLRTLCQQRGFVYYEPAFIWNYLGPLNNVPENGLLPQYRSYYTFPTDWDPAHYNYNCAAAMGADYAGMLSMRSARKKAA